MFPRDKAAAIRGQRTGALDGDERDWGIGVS